MLYGIEFRLYPNSHQREYFANNFGCVRWVYNNALAYCQEQYELGHKRPTNYELQKRLKVLKSQFDWLKNADSQALNEACKDLDSAYRQYFMKKEKGIDTNLPSFKSKHHSQKKFTSRGKFLVCMDSKMILLPKIGLVKFRGGREPSGKILRVTIRQSNHGIYTATAIVERNEIIPEPHSLTTPIGIDVGCKTVNFKHQLAVLSTGEIIRSPALLKINEKKIKRLQKRISRKQLGSSNRYNLKNKLSKLYWRIGNARSDFLHKTTHRLTSENQALAIEDLNLKGLMKRPSSKVDKSGNYLPNGAAKKAGLNRSLSDVALGEFFRQLEYKCAWRGVALVKIDRYAPSSKTCSVCGEINEELNLSIRQWECSCGASHHRDINAAINISKMALIG